MELRNQIMKILNGRSGFLNSDLNKQIGKLEVERHRNLINIVDKIWDERGLKGRNANKNI